MKRLLNTKDFWRRGDKFYSNLTWKEIYSSWIGEKVEGLGIRTVGKINCNTCRDYHTRTDKMPCKKCNINDGSTVYWRPQK